MERPQLWGLCLAALVLAGCSHAQGQGDGAAVLERPPSLAVESGGAAVEAVLGTWSWQYETGDGRTTSVEADSPHPLLCRDLLSPLETAGTEAELCFSQAPDAVLRVQCWSAEDEPGAPAEGEAVEREGDTILLRPGGWIYEAVAEWDAGGSGGTAHYLFYLTAGTAEGAA